MPFSVDLIRKLGEAGLTVFTADTFEQAPGGHSRFVEAHVVVPSPRRDTAAFVAAVARVLREREIDLLVPTFEEVFYLARQRAHLPAAVRCFFPSFDTLAELHHKESFLRMARGLGLPVPPTVLVTSADELRAAATGFGGYFARRAFGRGGIDVLTNRGPLAGAVDPATVQPTPALPWLVQPYLAGEEICTHSLAQGGELLAHVTYAHPNRIDGAGGVTFESLDSAETLPAARAIVARTAFTGQLGLDFLRSGDTLWAVECNPRATAGVSLLTADEVVRALRVPPAPLSLCPPGRRRKIAAGLLIDMLRDWHRIPEDLRGLFTGGADLYGAWDDPLPGLYQFLSYTHVLEFQRTVPEEAAHDLRDVVRAQFYDVCWNGDA